MAKNNKNNKMQDLIKSDNSIIKVLRDENWIYNPKVYAQISGDFSTLHQRVLLGVLEKLQGRILNSINEHQKTGSQWLPLFSPDELNGNIDFEIDPKDLGISHRHYKELAVALKDLVSMTIGYPQKKGKNTVYVFAPLFSRLEMPMTESGWRTGKIRVKMDKENVNDFLSMESGYTDHVAKIAQYAKKQRTPRIYIYLSTFRYKGSQKVAYDELCEFLGIDDETFLSQHKGLFKKDRNGNDTNKEFTVKDNPFHKFARVQDRILEPSRIEMDQLASENKIDFSFTYKPIYKEGQTKGNPDFIEFKIVLGSLGYQREHDREKYAKIQKLGNTMKSWCPDLNLNAFVELASHVSDVALQDYIDFAYKDVRKQVETVQPDDVASYVMKLLKDWIVKRKKIEKNAKAEEEKKRNLEIVEKARSVWPDFYAELSKELKQEVPIEFENYDGNSKLLTIALNDTKWVKFLESDENLDIYSKILHKYYGKIRLQYRKRSK